MVNVSQSQSNITDEVQILDSLRIIIISTMSTVPSFIFLYINGVMLFTLRSKPVFRDTCRYILLYNLLLADTVQLAQSQVQFLLSVCRVKLTYSLCTALSMLANLTTGISPLTLVVMPLERYVAVCFPLRHASIITIKNTNMAIVVLWAVSSLNNLTRVLLFLQFPFEKVERLQIRDLCSNIALVLGSLTAEYDKAYTCVLFVTAGVAVTFSYISVIVAARSASTDKALAHKAHYTLLLHLVQLGLSLSSTINNPLIIALSKVLTRSTFLWVQNVFYVCLIIFPRCLSSLIYGLRDQTIRPVLMFYLCCHLKAKISG
ncbi:olfactory receptor-like protein OLF4 [Austrofundulus limnaeus]|uniref:Olfactory receptor-like protein OLF4 n=1 Tax=Austrofundulus limnaeus TaxID=52670 RepID=A0A2I4CU77_AUSLI|nr:PREDICTED: olfactory receptor-like protein OLF4 [Austrofundulus limnaeus]